MRLFVAVPLDEETRHRMAHLVRARVPVMPGAPVSPQNWHLTLRFLGEVDEVTLDRVIRSLDAADLGGAFPMAWGGLGAFPRPSRASVLWVGIARGEDRLAAVAMATEAAFAAAGFPPEDRPFRPHLTLSRIRPPEDVRAVLRGEPLDSVPMSVDRVTIYQSRLGRGEATYSVVEEIGL
jgi:2'-5' RNA ligase